VPDGSWKKWYVNCYILTESRSNCVQFGAYLKSALLTATAQPSVPAVTPIVDAPHKKYSYMAKATESRRTREQQQATARDPQHELVAYLKEDLLVELPSASPAELGAQILAWWQVRTARHRNGGFL
jgi:hypothetical protein